MPPSKVLGVAKAGVSALAHRAQKDTSPVWSPRGWQEDKGQKAGGDRRTAVRVTDDHAGSDQVVSTYVLGTLQPT